MTQQATLRALDAEIMTAMKAAGLADAAMYGVTPCQVYVDRAAAFFGDAGEVAGTRMTVAFLLAEVTPARGGTVIIDSASYTLTEKVAQDESLATWVVTGA